MGNFFDTYFVIPLLNVLVVFYKLFEILGWPGKLGLAIIAFTSFIRLVMYPMFKKQMETTKKINDLRPHLDRIQELHKDDKTKLQQEQLRLYQEAGINPAAGCFLALVQIPVFLALYNALNFFVRNGEGTTNLAQINNRIYFDALKIQTIDLNFIGFHLTNTPANGGSWHYYIIPVVTGLLQYFQASTALTQPPAPTKNADGTDKQPSTSDEFQKAMQTQMKYFFPVMIGVMSFNFPVALSIYWNVFSIFSIIQYYLHMRGEKKTPTQESAARTSAESKAEEPKAVIQPPKKHKKKK